jgi:hypothetical protein
MRAKLEGGPADGLVVEVRDVAVKEYVAIVGGEPLVFSSYPDEETLVRAHGLWEPYEAVDPCSPEPVTFKHCG